MAVLFLILAVGGCSKEGSSNPARAEVPSGMPPLPAAQRAVAPAGGGSGGKVLERIDAGSYTYLRLQTTTGEVWAAVPKTDTPVGATVELAGVSEMKDFESKTLNRKWDRILFGTTCRADELHDGHRRRVAARRRSCARRHPEVNSRFPVGELPHHRRCCAQTTAFASVNAASRVRGGAAGCGYSNWDGGSAASSTHVRG
ncbi:MAG: hypothetical protein EXR72_27190 [Myxococcales bacterium]|nr:hypothetical protein [Myxococcales bacterium]